MAGALRRSRTPRQSVVDLALRPLRHGQDGVTMTDAADEHRD